MAALRPRVPRDIALELERLRTLPPGDGERFRGYGVMAMPFLSGHLLALRRFVASSIGPAYRSVWLREPAGRWTMFTDIEPARSCPRYFGPGVDRVVTASIEVEWRGPHQLAVTIPDAGLDWCIRLDTTPATRLLNVAGSILPRAIRDSGVALDSLAPVLGRSLRAGRLALRGTTPTGHRFTISPRRIWAVAACAAILDGRDLGPARPLARQTRLADFWLPNRGIFAFGSARFTPPG